MALTGTKPTPVSASASPSSAPPGITLSWSPEWTIETAADTIVVLTAGADRRLAVDGLDGDTLAQVRRWVHGASIAPVSAAEHQVLDTLVEIGAVGAVAGPGHAVSIVGDEAIRDDLARALGHLEVGVSDGLAAVDRLALVVRTRSNWPAPPAEVHLGVDLTLHHTVLLGPLVLPGVTACLGCTATRAARRWGEPVVASRPAILRHLPVVASLLAVQIDLVASGGSPLVNATVAWDLERGTTDRQSMYKLVGCSTCDAVPSSGRVALPWVTDGMAR